MPIKTLEIRSTTRIRVFWSSATGIPSAPGSYTLLSLDGRGAPPTAVAVLVVAADSTQRELVLSWELVGGASYSLSDGGSTTRFVTPEARPAISRERPHSRNIYLSGAKGAALHQRVLSRRGVTRNADQRGTGIAYLTRVGTAGTTIWRWTRILVSLDGQDPIIVRASSDYTVLPGVTSIPLPIGKAA